MGILRFATRTGLSVENSFSLYSYSLITHLHFLSFVSVLLCIIRSIADRCSERMPKISLSPKCVSYTKTSILSIPGKVGDRQEERLNEEIQPSDLEKAGPSKPSRLPSSVLQACQTTQKDQMTETLSADKTKTEAGICWISNHTLSLWNQLNPTCNKRWASADPLPFPCKINGSKKVVMTQRLISFFCFL